MPVTVHSLEFRAAFPDETGRAAYLDAGFWSFSESGWFVALVPGPPERIVGVVRYFQKSGEGGTTLDFRIAGGPGGELAGNQEEFLRAFLDYANPRGTIRYAEALPEGHPLEALLERAGFTIQYREQRFETGWSEVRERIGRTLQALEGKASPLTAAEIVPARDCSVEMALPLVCANGLMKERKLRAIWESPDPAQLDREASACLVLDGEVLGVVICADGGDCLRVPAIVGREDVPGARRRAIPYLMKHVLQVRADHGYAKFIFRANVDSARQTVNLAQRMGGSVLQEVRRWARTS